MSWLRLVRLPPTPRSVASRSKARTRVRIGLLTQKAVDRNQRSAFHDKVSHECTVSRGTVRKPTKSNSVLWDFLKKNWDDDAVRRSVSETAAT